MSSPAKSRIMFRADGSSQIGLGHVMRCLALADMLGDPYERRFAIVRPGPEVSTLIGEKGVETIPLETNELGEFLAAITPNDVVVLDGYSFDESYQRTIREKARALVFIDDLVAGHQVADVVINHAGNLTEYDYTAEPYTRFLLGPRYALLRPPFFVPAPATPLEGPIFVSLGGADPSNTTLTVLESLFTSFRLMNQRRRVHVVVGPLQANRPAIEALLEQVKHLHVLSNLTAEQMVAELTKCQLAVTSCSTVAYEVCSIGRPLIAIQTADNQTRLADFLKLNGLAEVVDGQLSSDYLAPLLRRYLGPGFTTFANDTIIRHQKHFFDGRSPERFRFLFSQLCA